MKTNTLHLIVVLTLLGAISALAQGTVYFSNNAGTSVCGGAGLRAPVYGPEPGNITLSKTGNTTSGLPAGTQTYGGGLLSGSGYLAQVYGAAGYGRLETDLVAATPVTTFRTGPFAGYVTAVTAAIPGTAEGGSATVQLRAWDNTSGLYPDWASAEPAWNLGLIAAGKAPLIFVSPLGGVSPPTYLCGLVSFNLYYQPVAPSVLTQPTNQLPAIGEPATFSVVAGGNPGFELPMALQHHPHLRRHHQPLHHSQRPAHRLRLLHRRHHQRLRQDHQPGRHLVDSAGLYRATDQQDGHGRLQRPVYGVRHRLRAPALPVAVQRHSHRRHQHQQLYGQQRATDQCRFLHHGGDQPGRLAHQRGGNADGRGAGVHPHPADQPGGARRPDATFMVQGAGTELLAYQWRFNDNPIPGATTNSYTVMHVQTGNAGSYTVVLTNLYGSETSQVATLTLMPVTNLTWTGAGATAYWNNTANWTPPGRGPGLGDTLIFPDGAAGQINTNDLTAFKFNGIRFTGSLAAYQLWGKPFTVTNFLQVTNGLVTNTIQANLVLAVTNLQVEVQTNAQLVLSNALSGPGGFTKIGPGTLTLSGSTTNTYQGPTVVNEGLLELNKNGALAISAGSLTVGDGIGGADADGLVRSHRQRQPTG